MSVTAGSDAGLVEVARRIADEVAAPNAIEVDKEARFPAETVAALREVRKGLQVADVLHLAPRQQRREDHVLRRFGLARRGHLGVEAEPHALEGAAAPVDAGDTGLDQVAGADEFAEKLLLIRRTGTKVGHPAASQTSLALSSRLAALAWMRPLATIDRAEIASRR